MALRSRKYRGSCLGSKRDEIAVVIRLAVARASRGGTMDRM